MFFSSSKNLMLVNERVLIIYPSDLFSVEFSSGISTVFYSTRIIFKFKQYIVLGNAKL